MAQESLDKRGYVYILVNPAFTGFVKIGKTTNEPEARARQLSSGSGVPAPYAVAWDAFVTDCHHVEKLIHQQLAGTRSRNDREFFATPLKHAIATVSSIVAPFSCEPEAPTETPTSNGTGISICIPMALAASQPRKRVPKGCQEELIEVAEDCPVDRAEPPPDGDPKTIARIGYEILVENPYKFTEREFYHELHAVRRERPDLKFDSYNIKRAPIVKVHGWGVHRNQDGMLALVAMESDRYRELQDSVKTTKAYRTSKDSSVSFPKRQARPKPIQEHLKVCLPSTRDIFEQFRTKVREIHPLIQENSWSYGVAYRARQNFVEVYFRANRLEVCLRPKVYDDPKGLLSKVPDSYRWTLNHRFLLEDESQLPDLIALVRQSWEDVR